MKFEDKFPELKNEINGIAHTVFVTEFHPNGEAEIEEGTGFEKQLEPAEGSFKTLRRTMPDKLYGEDDVEKYCLSKQRVKEAIEKSTLRINNNGIEIGVEFNTKKILDRKLLIKELFGDK